MDKRDIVQLSHRITPEKEHFKIETKVEQVRDMKHIFPDIRVRPDLWYICGEVTCCTHVGTHIEVPYHHLEDGVDLGSFPIHNLIGNCVVVDFKHKKHREEISLDEFKKYDSLIHKNDIVFIHYGRDKIYHKEKGWDEEPYPSNESILWLIDKEIACIGADSASIEVAGLDYQPNHEALFEAGIPIVESLTNLDKIENGKFIVVILPLQIDGLDSSPLRVVAIKKEALKNLL